MQPAFLKFCKSCCQRVDCWTEWLGRLLSWLVLVLVVLVSYDVAMRYLFNSGSVALQELEWHLFSIIFLMGAAYTFKHDSHVRLDLFYQSQHVSDLKRAWINLLGDLLFLLPFCALIIVCSWPFISQSYVYAEGSPDPGGLPYRWVLKSVIPLSFGLLMLQGIADACRQAAFILEQRR